MLNHFNNISKCLIDYFFVVDDKGIVQKTSF